MEEKLSFSHFFNRDHEFKFAQLNTTNILNLLGSSLTDRINEILTELEVNDEPVVLGDVHPQAVIEGRVYIAKGAKVGPSAYIQGPTYIGPGADIRHGAFIRGSAFIDQNAVVGHTTEVKGSIFAKDAKAGHFAYVGDSILGVNVNLGAGTKLANLKLAGKEVRVTDPESDEFVKTGLRKFGAILGENAQTGCNSVLSPGTLLLPDTAVMPCVHFHGTLKKGIAR